MIKEEALKKALRLSDEGFGTMYVVRALGEYEVADEIEVDDLYPRCLIVAIIEPE